jgi:DNA-binding beta-propeller fold protein YncE
MWRRGGIGMAALWAALLPTWAIAADGPYKVLKTIKVVDGAWDYAGTDFARGKIYWVRSEQTDVVDTKSHAISVLKNVGNGHLAVPVPGTSLIVVPMRTPAKTNRIVDTSSDKVIVDLPGGDAPDGAVYDPFSKHVFVMNHNGGDMTEIDPVAKTVVATIPVAHEKLEFPAADGAGKVFVNIQASGQIGVVDVASHKLVTTYKMGECKEASGLAYASGSKVLVAACGNGMAEAIDAQTGAELASIAIGKGPDSVIYDNLHQVAFVPCGTDGVVEVIDVKDKKAIRKVQSLKAPSMVRTGAIDKEGRLYLMSAEPDPNKPMAGGGRPTPKDGTFQLVVVGR